MLFTVLLALLSLIGAACAEDELISNGGFETLSEGEPDGWYTKAYRNQAGYSRISVTDEKAHGGVYSAMVENASLNDARFIYTASVEPNSMYRLSAYVLVESMEEDGNGANIAIEDIYAFSERLYDTDGEWQLVEWYGETGPEQRELTFGLRVGGYGAESVGKAYFDDVSLVKTDSLPADIVASIWYSTKAPASQSSSGDSEKSTAWFLLYAAAFAALLAFARRFLDKPSDKRAVYVFALLMAAGLALRLILAAKVEGYGVDIGCFTAWSMRIASVGPAGFYADGYFCDYPPGYILLLWPCGLLLNAVGLANTSAALVTVKSVPIIFDMLGAFLLYRVSAKRISNTAAAALSALYLLNPAVLVNGSAWGQADSVLALLIAITALLAIDKNWRAALPMYIVSILVKPQALLFAPIGGAWLIMCIVGDKKGRKTAYKNAAIGLGIGLGAAATIILPFSIGQERPFGWLIELYGKTLASYPKATLNTANLYYLFGGNWADLTSKPPVLLPLLMSIALAACGAVLAIPVLIVRDKRRYTQKRAVLGMLCGAFALLSAALCIVGANYELFGYSMMAFVFIYTLVCFVFDGRAEALPVFMAIALIGVYVIGIKIHERYLFPALLLMLIGFAMTRDRRLLALMLGFSITTFVNTAIVLDNSILFGASMGHLNSDTLTLNVLLCSANLALMGYAGYIAALPARKRDKKAEPELQPDKKAPPPSYTDMLLAPKDARMHLNWRDYTVMGITAVVYGILAIANLGSLVAPQEGWVATSSDEQVIFELEEPQEFSFMYYAGVSYNPFSISVSEDGQTWSDSYPCSMNAGLCYRWNYALESHRNDDGTVQYAGESPSSVLRLNGRFIRVNAEQAGLNLFEIAARDKDGEVLPIKLVGDFNGNPEVLDAPKPAENLINEQYACIGEPSWFNGMYFDEIYHARTGYEHLHGEIPFETTHPPLGKLLMSASIALFGMTPFGWRFAGAFIGILMLPALYLLAMQLTKKRSLATLSMLAFSFDLMHFTQTRIATIDSFPVFFIILTYLCMVRYMETDTFAVAEGEPVKFFSRAYLRSLIPLALCGAFMGLSIASKWIGIYSAVGLALLFAAAVYRQFRAGLIAYNYDLEDDNSGLTPNQRLRVRTAQDYALKRIFATCGFCVLFFIVIPCVIYYLSYIPYLSPSGRVTIRRVIQAQQGMFSYHSSPGLGADHPFMSPWWQWPFLMKPMWFWKNHYAPEGFSSTIMCMGNPWIYYIGIFCMVAVLVLSVLKYVRVRGGLRLRHGDGDLVLPVLSVGFLAQYLPWVLVPRGMYMYHYFASVPFIIVSTAWIIGRIGEGNPKHLKWIIAGYLAAAAVFFAAFFPYASGTLARIEWLDAVRNFFAWPSGLSNGLRYFFRIYY